MAGFHDRRIVAMQIEEPSPGMVECKSQVYRAEFPALNPSTKHDPGDFVTTALANAKEKVQGSWHLQCGCLLTAGTMTG